MRRTIMGALLVVVAGGALSGCFGDQDWGVVPTKGTKDYPECVVLLKHDSDNANRGEFCRKPR